MDRCPANYAQVRNNVIFDAVPCRLMWCLSTDCLNAPGQILCALCPVSRETVCICMGTPVCCGERHGLTNACFSHNMHKCVSLSMQNEQMNDD